MKKIIFAVMTLIFSFAYVDISMADDWEDYYVYQNMNKVPPPPPMNTVPYYVMDDYDDYVEDYYKCMLGVDWDEVCFFWQDYAKKNNIKIQSPYNNGSYNNMMPAGQNMPNNTYPNQQ